MAKIVQNQIFVEVSKRSVQVCGHNWCGAAGGRGSEPSCSVTAGQSGVCAPAAAALGDGEHPALGCVPRTTDAGWAQAGPTPR